MEVPQNTKIDRPTICSNNSTLGYLPEENKNTYLKRYLHHNFHSKIFIIAKIWKQPKGPYISPQWNLAAAVAAAAAKSLQLRLTLCDPIEGSLPGSPIPGILQARTLEWVAISFSNG